MRIEVVDERGDTISFEVPDTLSSRWTCSSILRGETYPGLPFLPQVETIVDVGANCGAATVHFARCHPDAVVHAIEPGREALGYLTANTRGLPNVVVHPVGLSDADGEAVLYLHSDDLGQSTVIASPGQPYDGPNEVVTLRDACTWAREQGITAIDVLKVDVEGCEPAVLRSLSPLVEGIKAIYVEYNSRVDRRTIEDLLARTHELYLGVVMTLDSGECLYIRRDLADHPEAAPRLLEIVFGIRDRQ